MASTHTPGNMTPSYNDTSKCRSVLNIMIPPSVWKLLTWIKNVDILITFICLCAVGKGYDYSVCTGGTILCECLCYWYELLTIGSRQLVLYIEYDNEQRYADLVRLFVATYILNYNHSKSVLKETLITKMYLTNLVCSINSFTIPSCHFIIFGVEG